MDEEYIYTLLLATVAGAESFVPNEMHGSPVCEKAFAKTFLKNFFFFARATTFEKQEEIPKIESLNASTYKQRHSNAWSALCTWTLETNSILNFILKKHVREYTYQKCAQCMI